jgi:hypothetical protein
MTSNSVLVDVSCAVEVFLATALLHEEKPERDDFTIQEITTRAAKENILGELRPGVNVHASQHCVANKAPNPAKHRMLYATGKHTRRLLMPGDEVHLGRTGKIFPDPDEVPEKYLAVLEWAKARYESARAAGRESREGESAPKGLAPSQLRLESHRRHLQVLLDLRLAGAHLAKEEDPDEYVRRLREGWE